MSYIAINGYELPPPKRGVRPIVTTVVDAGRNANGSVVGQREWPWLTAEQWRQILNALSNFFVYVTFVDPVTNSRKTIKMYPGDRTGEPYWTDNSGKPTHYRNCKVNLVDCGE